MGIDVYRLRILVFALSAALAGVGGALFGSLEGSLSANDFDYQISAVLLVVVAIVGLGSIAGAVVAGVVYATLQVAVTSLPTRFAGLVAVLFGLATLSYTRHPEGFLDYLSGRAQAAAGRTARASRRAGAPGAGPPRRHRRAPDAGGRPAVGGARMTAPPTPRCWWRQGSPSSSAASWPSTMSTSTSAEGEAVGVGRAQRRRQDHAVQLPVRTGGHRTPAPWCSTAGGSTGCRCGSAAGWASAARSNGWSCSRG